MPQGQNQNTTPNAKKAAAPKARAAAPAAANPNAQPQQPQQSQTPTNALNKALMRTFKGDATQSMGPKASNAAIKAMMPKGTPVKQQKQVQAQQQAPVAQPQKKNDAVVHTFKGDVQNLVRNQKVSMARMVALEADRTTDTEESIREEAEEKDAGPWKTTVIVSLAALFLVIGGVLSFAAYYSYQLNTAPNLTPQFEPAIIFTEAREQVDITGRTPPQILTLLASARRSTFYSLGSVVDLHPTQLIKVGEGEDEQEVYVSVNAPDFLTALEAHVPETFLQTLGPDYVIGIHTIDENVPFLILTTESYGHAFSGMLQWERNIEEDLAPFFSPSAEYVRPATAEEENSFGDTVIQNLDVRILRDSTETTRLLYTFVDRNTMVITTNVRTLVELANRLRVAEF